MSDITDTDRVRCAIERMEKAADELDRLTEGLDDEGHPGAADITRECATDVRRYAAILRGDVMVAGWLDRTEGD